MILSVLAFIKFLSVLAPFIIPGVLACKIIRSVLAFIIILRVFASIIILGMLACE
jgi:hypothetical protein